MDAQKKTFTCPYEEFPGNPCGQEITVEFLQSEVTAGSKNLHCSNCKGWIFFEITGADEDIFIYGPLVFGCNF